MDVFRFYHLEKLVTYQRDDLSYTYNYLYIRMTITNIQID